MRRQALFALCLAAVSQAVAWGNDAASFVSFPPEVRLQGSLERAQLVVRACAADGAISESAADLTHTATYESSDPALASVSAKGLVTGHRNGSAVLRVTVNGQTRETPVLVENASDKPQASFVDHVQPILNKAGCASAACHAAQHGQGGFKLSVFGFDPSADYQAMVRDRLARRVDRIEPDRSLILEKPAMRVPHGGGRRLAPDSADYQLLRAWIADGCASPPKESPKVERLIITPERRVAKADERQQLRVEAVYEGGRVRDVTAWTKFDSLDDGVVTANESGLASVTGQGQAAVMARFEGQAAVSLFVVPYAESVDLAGWESRNYVDEFAAAKFRELGIEPSPVCDDATFIRRAFLDATGSLPTIEEVRAFLAVTESDKRERLVDRLLGLTGDPAQDIYNDRYAAFWTLKWSDLIRNTSGKLGDQGMWALHNWIKESLRVNKPFDHFVRELVTAKGSIYSNGPANYFRINSDSAALTESTAQIFLGVRLECAKCHHHPFEKHSQEDYYGLSAFFSRVGTKNSQEFGLFGREQVVVVRDAGSVRHPRTGQVMNPTPLDGEPLDHPLDLRIALAEWLTAPENPWFARSIANRYMGYLLGRGLVEPIDDIRSTNPPSNPPLLDALAKEFTESGYNLKRLVRTIMTSRLYQLSSQPNERNRADSRFYSYYYVKRLAAEPLLDAVDQAAGTQTKFPNLPLGTRAIELPDAEYPDYFLTTFAKPRRASVCECERSPDANLAQALHTLNGDGLARKIAEKSARVAKLVAADKPHGEIVEELYLAALCRLPNDEERAVSGKFIEAGGNPAECYEDLLWALMNSKQFLFVH